MVPDPAYTCYGLEYFCFEGDGLWNLSDAELIELAKRELAQVGLAKYEDVTDGCVVRQRKAYPVYDDDYAQNVAIIRDEIAQRFPNLHLVGRNGMHKYNNQDHAMMTAMLTVENILGRKAGLRCVARESGRGISRGRSGRRRDGSERSASGAQPRRFLRRTAEAGDALIQSKNRRTGA